MCAFYIISMRVNLEENLNMHLVHLLMSFWIPPWRNFSVLCAANFIPLLLHLYQNKNDFFTALLSMVQKGEKHLKPGEDCMVVG